MVMRVLLSYLAVELLAVTALAWAFGPWWAFAAVIACFAAGPLLVGSQLRRQLVGLRAAARRPDEAITDGVVVAAGSTLVLLPGVVSTVLGGFMLAPPTRGAMRPLAQAMLSRSLVRRFGAFDLSGPRRGDFIDGQVVDGQVIDGQVIDGEVIGADRVSVTPNLPARL